MANKKYNEFTAGTPVGTDLVLYGDPSTGALKKVTIDNMNTAIGLGVIKRVKVTLDYTDFAVAAQSNSINIGFTMPAGGVLHGIHINESTPFAITADFYNIRIGYSGNADWAMATTDLLTTGEILSEPGLSFEIISHSTATPMTINIDANTNLDQATAGVLDIWIYYSVLD